MCLRIHLYSLHLDAQYGQTWHLSTQLRSWRVVRGEWRVESGEWRVVRGEWRMDRGLVDGFCCYRPYYATARFRSHSSYMLSGEPFLVHVLLTSQMGSHPITFLWLWPATDNEPHCRHVPINKIWRWTESTPRSGWWRSHMAGIYSDWSTREIIPAAVITDRVYFNEWVFLPNKPNKQAFSLYILNNLVYGGEINAALSAFISTVLHEF